MGATGVTERTFLVAVLAIISAIALVSLPGTWSGRRLPALERRFRVYWVWGEASLRGSIRATPVAVIGGNALVAAAIALLVREAIGDAFARTVLLWVGLAAFAASLLCLLLMVTVVLFNAPKAVVPPPLRHEPGLLAEWRRNRKPRPPHQRDPTERQ